MPGRRKLFITHAGELAHRIVLAVGRSGLIVHFVRSYAHRFHRLDLLVPERLHEIESTLGREAFLVMAVDLRNQLPAVFAHRPGAALSPEEAELADAFFTEFLASLGRAMGWPASEAAAEDDTFRRDMMMYQQWSVRSARLMAIGTGESPFADRCAILLDPSMMDEARKEGAAFEREIIRTGRRIFSQLGRISSRPRAKKVQRQAPGRPRPVKRLKAPKRPAAAKAKVTRKAPKRKTAKRPPPPRPAARPRKKKAKRGRY